MKTIGNKRTRTPEECLITQNKLIFELEQIRPNKKKKGIILKFKTWKESEEFDLKRAVDYVEPKG
ncbi:MAG: hypothetical protein H7A23_19550 [Leptospiraceae bacterium]|nr:hypothetical protein [Leptospiraceae bacterium]MCP5496751.1 hypothetical protein [Leptospiraceae bacterium]